MRKEPADRGVKWDVGSPRSVKPLSPTKSEFCTLSPPPSGGTIGDWPGWSSPSGQDPHGCLFAITFQTITLISFGKPAQSSSRAVGGGGGDRRDDVL